MRIRPALASAAALSLTLAACSGDADTAADDTATDASVEATDSGDAADEAGAPTEIPEFDPTSVEADPDVVALVPEAVASDGQLSNGVSANYPPAEFFDPADGTTFTGWDLQLGSAMAAKMGLELVNEHAEFASIIPGIGTKYEVGISSFSVTAERLDAVNFTTYIEAGSLWAVASGNPSGFDPDAVCGAVVGVQTGTIQHDAAEELKAECEADGESLTVEPYPNQRDVTTNLVGGKLDAMFADSPVVRDAEAKTNGSIETIGDLRMSSLVGAVTAKDQLELAEAVRAAYQSLIDDGTYAEILNAWDVTDGHVETAEVNPVPES